MIHFLPSFMTTDKTTIGRSKFYFEIFPELLNVPNYPGILQSFNQTWLIREYCRWELKPQPSCYVVNTPNYM